MRAYNKKHKENINNIDALNHILGKYIAFAFNDPKNYPNEPFTLSNEKKEMTNEEMETQARRNTIKLGGVINDS